MAKIDALEGGEEPTQLLAQIAGGASMTVIKVHHGQDATGAWPMAKALHRPLI